MGLPIALVGYPVGVYLPDLYSGEMGVPLAAVGAMLMLARWSDAITDPIMGFASDRVHTRFGRRKPWIAAGVPVMLLGVWMLFTPAPGATRWYLLLWYGVMTLGSTLITLPYRAWGAELSSDYHTRTRIVSAGEVLVIIGLIAAAAVPFAAKFIHTEGLSSATILRYLALVLMTVLPVVVGLLLWLVPEPVAADTTTDRGRGGLGRTLQLMSDNGLFRLLIAIELLVTGGENFRNALSLFFMRDVIGVDVANIATMYLLYFVVGLVAIPVWTSLAKRLGKHRALACAMVLVSIVSVWIFTLERGQLVAFYILFAIKGFCFGAFSYLPRAMIADVVDVDTAKTRMSRAGSYFAVHGIITKVAGAAGAGLSLMIVDWVGYVARKGGDAGGLVNGPDELRWLGVLYAIVPTVLFLGALYLAWTYPLTRERHARLEAAILRRDSRLARAATGGDA